MRTLVSTVQVSYRDLVEMMAERGLSLAHTTILRWVQRFVPAFEKRWNRYARPTGSAWRVDETYTLDGYAASHRAVRELQEQDEVLKTAKLRSSKYWNNVIEQDHRTIKLRWDPCSGSNSSNQRPSRLRGSS